MSSDYYMSLAEAMAAAEALNRGRRWKRVRRFVAFYRYVMRPDVPRCSANPTISRADCPKRCDEFAKHFR